MTFYYTIYTDNWKCLIIGIVVVDVTGRIHIPHIVSIARVRGTGYYGSYPILNTQSVNTIFLIFNFPPTGGYQLHRLFTTTLDWKNFLPFLLSIHEDKLRLPGPQRIGARSEALFDKFFLPLLSYQSSVTQITDMVNYSYLFLAQYLVQISEKGLAPPHSHKR